MSDGNIFHRLGPILAAILLLICVITILYCLILVLIHCIKFLVKGAKLVLNINEKTRLKYPDIHVIQNEYQLYLAMQKLKADCKLVPLLSFDCEWNMSTGPYRRPVALLQLESYYGVCALIQLRYFSRKGSLESLKELLEDQKIIKIGVAPQGDANFLFQDFDLKCYGTFDLRFMAKTAGCESGGLKKMCTKNLHILNYDIDPFMHHDWEELNLSSNNIKYASCDVHYAIDLFDFFANKLDSKRLLEMQSEYITFIINQYCAVDMEFYYESCFNTTYIGNPIRLNFQKIDEIFSQKSGKRYKLPSQFQCLVCKRTEKYHRYFSIIVADKFNVLCMSCYKILRSCQYREDLVVNAPRIPFINNSITVNLKNVPCGNGLQPRYRDEYLRERNDARRGIWISLMPHLEYCPTVLDDLMLSTNNVRPQELDLY